jgi:hypothetical protein
MSLDESKDKEVAAEICEEDVMKAYARLRASLESLSFVKNLLGDFLYTDIGYLGNESAIAMFESIKMRIGFIRESITLVNPALDVIEEYLVTISSDSSEEPND